LSAQVAEAFYDLMESRTRRELLERQKETNETFLELAQLRFSQGLASAVDVYQQRQQVISTRAQLALVTASETVSSNQLGALVGEAPRGVRNEDASGLPTLPPLPAVGVPSTVLRQRPDLRSAKRRIVAADYRVGTAIAEYFPRINLRGSLGFGAQSLRDLFEDVVWSVVASISETIWDGGRRGAEVSRRKAAVQERVEQYGEAVVRALVEVDNALAQEKQQHIHIAELEQQVENAQNTLREAQARYQEGLTDYLPVLSALSAHQQAELGLLTARRRLLSMRIQLHRALGGTWTHELALEEREIVEEDEEEHP
jgi:NodT family efflux transporter outer membrane factor (OMF) lipoprotein